MEDACTDGPASYDHLGNRFVLLGAEPGLVVALDVERWDHIVPDVIQQAISAVDHHAALRRWTELEVIAKLASLPILSVLGILRREPEVFQQVQAAYTICRADTPQLCIAAGYRRQAA